MGCGLSTASGRRSCKRVHSKTKKYDVFIERIPRSHEPGDRRHAQYPLGPADVDFRWPTNRRGIPSNESEFEGRDPRKRLYTGKKPRNAFVVRRVAEHDKNHELGMQVERKEEGEPVEGGVEMPMGSTYKGQAEGWQPYEQAFWGAEFRGGRLFEPLEKEAETGQQGGGQQQG